MASEKQELGDKSPKTPLDLVRAVCYSHRQKSVETKDGAGKCQFLLTIIESQSTGKFLVSGEFFLIEGNKFHYAEHEVTKLETALDWIGKVAACMESFDPPEMLFLPEWRGKEEVEKNIDEWAENLLGPNWKNQLTIG